MILTASEVNYLSTLHIFEFDHLIEVSKYPAIHTRTVTFQGIKAASSESVSFEYTLSYFNDNLKSLKNVTAIVQFNPATKEVLLDLLN
jgi:hypothetical protein